MNGGVVVTVVVLDSHDCFEWGVVVAVVVKDSHFIFLTFLNVKERQVVNRIAGGGGHHCFE